MQRLAFCLKLQFALKPSLFSAWVLLFFVCFFFVFHGVGRVVYSEEVLFYFCLLLFFRLSASRGVAFSCSCKKSNQKKHVFLRLRSTSDVQWLVGGSLRLQEHCSKSPLLKQGRAGNLKFHHRSKFSALDMVCTVRWGRLS